VVQSNDKEVGEQRASIPRLPDLLRVDRAGVAGERIAPASNPTGDELRFLRTRMVKSSKDFAELAGVTSEQYARIGRSLDGFE